MPDHLRNVKLRTADADDTTSGYVYPHDHDGHFVDQEYGVGTRKYYEPGSEGYEDVIARRMAKWQAKKNNV